MVQPLAGWRMAAGPARVAACLVLAAAFAWSGPALAKGEVSCGTPATVVLDIGHSPGAPGARSARGRPEYAFNKRFAHELAQSLEVAGFATRVLNPNGANLSLSRRGAEIAKIGQGVLISVHHDSVQPHYLSEWTVNGRTERYSDLFRGFSLFISNRSGHPRQSTSLARAIGGALRQAGYRPSLHHGEAIKGENRPVIDADNGVFGFDDLVVLRNAQIAAVLFEVGVIVNRAEEAALDAPQTRAQIVAAVVAGVRGACGLPDPGPA